MNREYKYIKITGGKLAQIHADFMEQRSNELGARSSLCAIFGAIGCYANSREIRGLQFPSPSFPEGWEHLKGAGFDTARPKDKKLRKEMAENYPLRDGREYHEAITEGDSFGFAGPSDRPTGFALLYVRPETIDGVTYLHVPAGPECPDGTKWLPKSGDFEPVKASEYWAEKERIESLRNAELKGGTE